MQEATVSALKYDARPLLGSTALKVDGKSCDTQVSPKHPDFFWYHHWALQLQEEVAKSMACLGEGNHREWTAQPQQIF